MTKTKYEVPEEVKKSRLGFYREGECLVYKVGWQGGHIFMSDDGLPIEVTLLDIVGVNFLTTDECKRNLTSLMAEVFPKGCPNCGAIEEQGFSRTYCNGEPETECGKCHVIYLEDSSVGALINQTPPTVDEINEALNSNMSNGVLEMIAKEEQKKPAEKEQLVSDREFVEAIKEVVGVKTKTDEAILKCPCECGHSFYIHTDEGCMHHLGKNEKGEKDELGICKCNKANVELIPIILSLVRAVGEQKGREDTTHLFEEENHTLRQTHQDDCLRIAQLEQQLKEAKDKNELLERAVNTECETAHTVAAQQTDRANKLEAQLKTAKAEGANEVFYVLDQLKDQRQHDYYINAIKFEQKRDEFKASRHHYGSGLMPLPEQQIAALTAANERLEKEKAELNDAYKSWVAKAQTCMKENAELKASSVTCICGDKMKCNDERRALDFVRELLSNQLQALQQDMSILEKEKAELEMETSYLKGSVDLLTKDLETEVNKNVELMENGCCGRTADEGLKKENTRLREALEKLEAKNKQLAEVVEDALEKKEALEAQLKTANDRMDEMLTTSCENCGGVDAINVGLREQNKILADALLKLKPKNCSCGIDLAQTGKCVKCLINKALHDASEPKEKGDVKWVGHL
jgi:hypothetical protein